MLRIGLGVATAFYGGRAIRRYAISLARELSRIAPDCHLRLLAWRRGNSPSGLPADSARVRLCPTGIPGRLLVPLWNVGLGPPVELFTGRLDVFHSTDFDVPCVRRAARAFTVHGINYLMRPDLLPPDVVLQSRRELERAVKRADLFLAVSDHTKDHLLERYPALQGRVHVTPLGLDPGFSPEPRPSDEEHRRVLGARQPYVLFVGSVSMIKNVKVLLQATEDLDVQVVLAGGVAGADAELRERVGQAVARGRALLTGWIDPDGEPLRALYRGAAAFAFPTLSEGWTSPPLEAMASGVPVVASNASSVPETVGDGALLADPTPEAFRAALERVLTDSALREDLIGRGLARAAEITWEDTARKTLEAYREVTGR